MNEEMSTQADFCLRFNFNLRVVCRLNSFSYVSKKVLITYSYSCGTLAMFGANICHESAVDFYPK